jgi:hypothetical protein
VWLVLLGKDYSSLLIDIDVAIRNCAPSLLLLTPPNAERTFHHSPQLRSRLLPLALTC